MAGVVLGNLRYILGLDSLAFEKGLGGADKRLKAAQRSFQKTADKFSSVGKTMSLGLTLPLGAFATGSFKAASDAAELQSAFDQTFGKMSATMNKWAEDTGNAMGRSTTEMKKAANTFGIFFNTAVDPAKAAKMSQTFAKLAQDLGSFYNVDTQTAIEKLRSGLSGESEPMRDFGVFLTEASVKAKALQLGLTGVGNELTEQEKILARYHLILESTTKAQGDVARTSSGTANQLRRAQAAFEELQVIVGTKLLPVLTPLITKLADALNWFSQLPAPIQNISLGFVAVTAALGPLLIGFGAIVSSFGTLLPLLLKLGPAFAVIRVALVALTPLIWGAVKAMAAMALTPVGAVITGIALAVGAVYLAWKNWDKIKPYIDKAIGWIRGLWEKARPYFEYLKAALLGLLGPIGTVTRAFYTLYDKVVGHSYIPDMVDEIGENIARLQGNMVKPIQGMTQAAADAFKQLQTEIGGILARLFPTEGAISGLQAELKQLDEALAAKLISPEVWSKARERLDKELAELRQKASEERASDIGIWTTEEAQRELESWSVEMGDIVPKVEAANDNFASSFEDMTRRVADSVGSLVDAIRGGDFFDILDGVIGVFSSLGSTGLFGTKIADAINMPSFGGFRANGGPVSSGRSYIVGERGPEWFTPGRSGYITPSSKSGGSSRATNIFDMRGAVVTQDLLEQMNVIAASKSAQVVGLAGARMARRSARRTG